MLEKETKKLRSRVAKPYKYWADEERNMFEMFRTISGDFRENPETVSDRSQMGKGSS